MNHNMCTPSHHIRDIFIYYSNGIETTSNGIETTSSSNIIEYPVKVYLPLLPLTSLLYIYQALFVELCTQVIISHEIFEGLCASKQRWYEAYNAYTQS
jgi:hypothetical protein